MRPVAVETHQITLHTLDGLQLSADLAAPVGAPAGTGVAICHPHPRFGGDRHNAVVDALFRRFGELGLAVVRFDFRGVGSSEGEHGDGVDERLDAAAAIDALAAVTDGPIWLAGYSFGAAVALDVTVPRLEGWLAVAPPLAVMRTDRLAGSDHRRKALLVAGHDQFSGPDATAAACSEWRSTESTVLPTADHFFAGHLGQVCDWATATLGLTAPG
ncbi:MAG: hypothetical protein RI958_956 [Actinomycetota bacterium]